MRLSDFDYPLPKELIAQKPLEKRDASKLLVINRKENRLEDRHFSDIASYLKPGDVLALNDAKVFKSRLVGNKSTGGKVDLLILEPYAKAEPGRNVWRALIQPAPKEGHRYVLGGAQAAFVGRDKDAIALVEFEEGCDVPALAQRIGTMPLPPYIKREPEKDDESTYQTVYARQEGAVAAPTAGLHFTEDLLSRIRASGVEVVSVTLHVGYGTFKPVDDLENHRMHAERFELTQAVADRINAAKDRGSRIWAVGTTALRVLETCVREKRLAAGKGETDLYIYEPFRFEAVDCLITNFHLPKTTLLLLVSAFMGEPLRKKAYAHAIAEKYRFYSYGDAMLIL